MSTKGKHKSNGHVIFPANHHANSRLIETRHACNSENGAVGFDYHHPNILERYG